MKRNICILLFLVCAMTASFASSFGWEFGIGSGYVYYGDADTRARNKQINDANQVLLNLNAAALLKISPMLYFALGVDSMTDFRWRGSDHINMLDYAGVMGFRIYPGAAGLMFNGEYALGRRTDFISTNDADDEYIHSTQWGNGFKFGLIYDFGWQGTGVAPIAGFSWRHMPRGGSSDEIIAVFFRIVCK